jgi:hypothetical protein
MVITSETPLKVPNYKLGFKMRWFSREGEVRFVRDHNPRN